MPTRWLVVGLAAAGVAGGVTLGLTRQTTSDAATPGCAVSAPAKGAPLRTDSFGTRQTVIVVAPGEVPALIPDELDAYLREQGAVLAKRRGDGSVSVKVGWERDRRAAGRLRMSAKRLNRRGGRYRVEINDLYGGDRFARIVPSELFLSTTGCWRVRARAGKARVTYVVLVRRPNPGELDR